VATAKIDSLMSMVTISGSPKESLAKASKLLAKSKEAADGIRELEEIAELSKAYGTAVSLVVDLSLVRGLDYYTGPIYEISAKSKSAVGSISGGGRYDRLIELYGGPPTPATGGSLGVERICDVMEKEGMFRDVPACKTRILVVSAGDDEKLKAEAIKASQKLRSAGIAAETDLMGRRLKQLFEYAEKSGIPYMIIIGEKELASGKLVLKDLAKREQRELDVQSIIKQMQR
jgi:histidyl-tRNA synthetase